MKFLPKVKKASKFCLTLKGKFNIEYFKCRTQKTLLGLKTSTDRITLQAECRQQRGPSDAQGMSAHPHVHHFAVLPQIVKCAGFHEMSKLQLSDRIIKICSNRTLKIYKHHNFRFVVNTLLFLICVYFRTSTKKQPVDGSVTAVMKIFSLNAETFFTQCKN